MIELTTAHITELIAMRGGCTCFISPPCRACTDEPTEDEVEALGIDQSAAPACKPAPQLVAEVWNTTPVSADRAMAAVRAMCGGA